MRNLFTNRILRSFAVAATIAAAGFSTSTASASKYSDYQPSYGVSYSPEPECHRPSYYWKEVTVYETREVPEVRCITKYDHCGKPYEVKVVVYRTIRVPVVKRIKVAY